MSVISRVRIVRETCYFLILWTGTLGFTELPIHLLQGLTEGFGVVVN